MIAYFSSRLTKQMYAAFSVAMLVFCLLGTHWVGLSHSVSHGISQSKTLESKATSQVDKSFSHSSDVCHLFDALSLAGFIPSSVDVLPSTLSEPLTSPIVVHSFAPKLEIDSYQSRAPPTFIL